MRKAERTAKSGWPAVLGITVWVRFRGLRNVPQKYMVKWDEGSSTVIEERHLTVLPEPEAGGPTVTTADNEATGMSDHLTRDAEVTNDEDKDIDVEGAEPVALADVAEAVITPLNGVVQCGEFRWRRVKAIANDPRMDHPEFDFSIRNVSLTETTSLN